MADKLSDRLRSLARNPRRDYEETGAALMLAADALDLAEQHELEHLARHADESLRAASGDAEPEDPRIEADAVMDGSPEGALFRIVGWGSESVVIGGYGEAARIVEGLSVREFRHMLGRLEDRVRAAEAEKALAIFTKKYATGVVRGTMTLHD